MKKINTRGFSLIEMIVAMGLFAILVTTAIVAINPSRQFAEARDTQRLSHLHSLLTVLQKLELAKLTGQPGCAALNTFPVNETRSISSASNQFDLHECVVPAIMSEVPIDPKVGTRTDVNTYDTGYTLTKDEHGKFILKAPSSEVTANLTVNG